MAKLSIKVTLNFFNNPPITNLYKVEWTDKKSSFEKFMCDLMTTIQVTEELETLSSIDINGIDAEGASKEELQEIKDFKKDAGLAA